MDINKVQKAIEQLYLEDEIYGERFADGSVKPGIKPNYKKLENLDKETSMDMNTGLDVNRYDDSTTRFDPNSSDVNEIMNKMFREHSHYNEEVENTRSVFELVKLPAEMIHEITKHMDLYSLANLAIASRNQVDFGSYAKKTFLNRFKREMVLNRHHLETGQYKTILSEFGLLTKELSIINDKPSAHVAWEFHDVFQCLGYIYVHVDLQCLITLHIQDFTTGFFVEDFVFRSVYLKFVLMTKLHLHSPAQFHQMDEDLILDHFPCLEDLILEGLIPVKTISPIPPLRRLTLRPYPTKFLPLEVVAPIRPFLTFVDIQDEIPLNTSLNKIIRTLHGYLAHQTLRIFRFSGHMAMQRLDPDRFVIVDQIMQFKRLVELDIRFVANGDGQENTNYLCIEKNVLKLIHLTALETLTLIEPRERHSNGIVLKLFGNLPNLKDLVAIRIVGKRERERIQAIHPTYRRVSKYSSTIR